MYYSSCVTDQWLQSSKYQQQQQEVPIPESDQWQEAADYAELQMDGGDVRGLRWACGAKGPRPLMPERAVFRLATQRRAACHLGAQEKPEIDAISFSITVKSPDCVRASSVCPSAPLSFDPRGDRSVRETHSSAYLSKANHVIPPIIVHQLHIKIKYRI